MPITPSVLARRTAACSMEYAGETLHIAYYPAAITQESAQELQTWVEHVTALPDDTSEEQQHAELVPFGAWICKILARWDFLQDDGETMQPITPDNLAAWLIASPDFIASVIVAILQDRARGNASGTTPPEPSGATSSPVASSTASPVVSSQNRSVSSSPRAGSTGPRRSRGSLRTPNGGNGQRSV